MTIVVGYAVDQGGRAALDLGVQLARAAGDSLLAVTVVPRPWPTPSMAKIDGEFADWASAQGAESVAQAKAYLATIAGDLTTDAVSAAGKSVPGTLVTVLEEHGADLLVIGSADDGRHGRIAVGSTASRLLHSSPVPVVLAPRGYRVKAGVASPSGDLLLRGNAGRIRGAPAGGRGGEPIRHRTADRHLRGAGQDHVPTGNRPAQRGCRADRMALASHRQLSRRRWPSSMPHRSRRRTPRWPSAPDPTGPTRWRIWSGTTVRSW